MTTCSCQQENVNKCLAFDSNKQPKVQFILLMFSFFGACMTCLLVCLLVA